MVLVSQVEDQVCPAGESLEELEIASSSLKSLKVVERWRLNSLLRLKVGQGILESLSGIATCRFLQELVCPFNRLVSLDELWGHSSLEILDVEANHIADPGNWMVLHSIPTLRELDIAGNPIFTNNPTVLEHSCFSALEIFNGAPLKIRPDSRISTASSSRPAPSYRVKAFPAIQQVHGGSGFHR